MRISSKLQYSLRALFDIAFHKFGGPAKIDEIATREDIPPRFLEQIFQDLKAAGIVGSKRGPKGGYFLLQSPESVTLGAVYRAIEGEIEHPCCFLSDDEMREKCAITSKCVTSALWRDVAVRVSEVLDSYTLSDLSIKGEALGLSRDNDADFTWMI